MCLARNHEALCVAGAVTMQRVPHTGVSFLSIFFKQLHEGCVGSLTQGVGLGFLVLFANVDGPSSSFNSAVKDKTWQLSESLDGSETCFPWKLSKQDMQQSYSPNSGSGHKGERPSKPPSVYAIPQFFLWVTLCPSHTGNLNANRIDYQ